MKATGVGCAGKVTRLIPIYLRFAGVPLKPVDPRESLNEAFDSLRVFAPAGEGLLMWDPPAEILHQRCDWCRDYLTTRIFHYEGQRYCSSACFNSGTIALIGAPLFEAKPFPPGMALLKARAR